ncbi:MAG: acetyl-CoA carboxylase carboxyltransferase subunit alpha [Candidatus Latescibacteria bacterium]|nr:acetyl-CoA carboxylase carboxyltransferase subunit alpha [bacterium]MBD3423145.1 acetyl-CoA carboxylase carboxyltransferase subunit alpha [Candidatus Latescibacterota bacterium]
MAVGKKRKLEFESPVYDLEEKIEAGRQRGLEPDSAEMKKLAGRLEELEEKVYSGLSPWEEVQLARHPDRPTALQYIGEIFDEFLEFHGDRYFGDDPAVVGGLASLGGRRVMVVGHEKGRNTRDRLKRNFGMASPEGFRKSLRLMKLAEKFSLPIVSLVDTPGAYPGVGAEERGQSVAIASNLKNLFDISSPIIVVIIGEGGSGGALALAIGDTVLMMEHAVYSVISPEGCAAILYKNKDKAPEAASSLRLTSSDCLELKVIDEVIREKHGAAHRDQHGNAEQIKRVLVRKLSELEGIPGEALLKKRVDKFSRIGIFNG